MTLVIFAQGRWPSTVINPAEVAAITREDGDTGSTVILRSGKKLYLNDLWPEDVKRRLEEKGKG
jgi:hypothetical protein